MSRTTIEVKIKPYLKKYIIAHFAGEPIALRRDDLFGIVLYGSLEKTNGHKSPPVKKDTNLVFTVPSDTYIKGSDPRHSGIRISQAGNANFCSWVQKLFQKEMFMYLDANLAAGNEIQGAILRFLDRYGITTDELKYEAAKKSYYRYRLRREEAVKSRK